MDGSAKRAMVPSSCRFVDRNESFCFCSLFSVLVSVCAVGRGAGQRERGGGKRDCELQTTVDGKVRAFECSACPNI